MKPTIIHIPTGDGTFLVLDILVRPPVQPEPPPFNKNGYLTDQEGYRSPLSGKEYDQETIFQVGSNYYRKDNQGPHSDDEICEMYNVQRMDLEWIRNIYNQLD